MGFRTLTPAVQGALYGALAGAADGDVQVSLGYPAGGLAAEQIWVPVDFDSTIAWATTGWTQREEDGEVEVRIAVLLGTDDPLAPQARALVLAGLVEDALAADRTLGGLVDRAEVSALKGQEAIPDEHQRQYGVTVTVAWAGEATA
jgi:hypothetical protein